MCYLTACCIKHRMFLLCILLLPCTLLNRFRFAAEPPREEPFLSSPALSSPALINPSLGNQRVLWLGDSITQDGQYVTFVEYYLNTRQPDQKIDIISIGLSSETVSGNSGPILKPRRAHYLHSLYDPESSVDCVLQPPAQLRIEVHMLAPILPETAAFTD